jgi:ADP-heptose:LPS heptosyltransferase
LNVSVRKFLIGVYSFFLWVLDSIYLSIHNSSINKKPSVLVVRLDNIGDFILWLPSVVKIRKRYKDQNLILVANKNFAELAKDTKYFDKIIAINVRKLSLNPFYRWKVFLKITKLNVKTAIQPNYSRSFLTSDSVIRASNAVDKIGSVGDLSNIMKWQKTLSDGWYTQLIFASSGPLMELERDVEFLSALGINTEEVCTPQLPHLTKLAGELDIDSNYFIIFPGASWAGRKWSKESFSKVGSYVYKHYGYKMVLCGIQADFQDAEFIINQASDVDAVNLTGVTTLSQFCELVRGAKLLIGNETSAVHIAAATNTPSVCLLGGGHFGRFMPYSDIVVGMKPIPVFSKMDCYGCNWQCTQMHNNTFPVLCIDRITTQMVINNICL